MEPRDQVWVLARHGPGRRRTTWRAVPYTSDGDTTTYTFDHGFRLCNEKVASAKTCEALKV
jgi:hypothetical protein